MHNDILTIGPFTIHGYGLMIAIGILVGMHLAEKSARANGLSDSHTDNIVYTALAVGWASSKLTYILINLKDFLADPMSFLSSSGWVVFGGILGGILGGYLYCRIRKLDFREYFNLIIPYVALAQAFGRVGCFLAGCCYGIETTLPIGVVFPAGSLAVSGVRLLPTQLFSALGDFCLFLILRKTYRNKDTRYKTGAMYLILYSFGRFMIEFIRGDVARGFIGVFSTSQFISLFTFAAGIILFTLLSRKENKTV